MTFIPDYWDCIADVEQEIAVDMAEASASMIPYVLMAVVDAHFAAASPGWWEVRRDAWLENWDVETGEIVIGEDPIAVAFANRPWMTRLFSCRLTGGCPYGQEDCKTLTFYD